jgi:hypothetical protein
MQGTELGHLLPFSGWEYEPNAGRIAAVIAAKLDVVALVFNNAPVPAAFRPYPHYDQYGNRNLRT